MIVSWQFKNQTGMRKSYVRIGEFQMHLLDHIMEPIVGMDETEGLEVLIIIGIKRSFQLGQIRMTIL